MSAPTAPSLDALLRVLNTATDKGTLRWEATPEEGTFRAVFGSGMVRISNQSNDFDRNAYRVTFFDVEGTILDEIFSTSSDWASINDLYKKARNKALHVDSKLKGLYDALRGLAGES